MLNIRKHVADYLYCAFVNVSSFTVLGTKLSYTAGIQFKPDSGYSLVVYSNIDTHSLTSNSECISSFHYKSL